MVSCVCHDLANDIYSQTAKTVFKHLKRAKNSWDVDEFNLVQASTYCRTILEALFAIICLMSTCPFSKHNCMEDPSHKEI